MFALAVSLGSWVFVVDGVDVEDWPLFTGWEELPVWVVIVLVVWVDGVDCCEELGGFVFVCWAFDWDWVVDEPEGLLLLDVEVVGLMSSRIAVVLVTRLEY